MSKRTASDDLPNNFSGSVIHAEPHDDGWDDDITEADTGHESWDWDEWHEYLAESLAAVIVNQFDGCIPVIRGYEGQYTNCNWGWELYELYGRKFSDENDQDSPLNSLYCTAWEQAMQRMLEAHPEVASAKSQ